MKKVSVITPTVNRSGMLERCIQMFLSQDYEHKEMIVVLDDLKEYDRLEKLFPEFDIFSPKSNILLHNTHSYGNKSVGAKRNQGCFAATGEIILHMDDDDIYAKNWVTRSVKALTESNGNLTGLRRVYFKSDTQTWLYEYPAKAQAYVVGATMCYYRSMWEKNPFRDINRGEDTIFASRAIVRPHDYIEGFTAILHGGNTASHLQLGSKEFTLVQ